jgi:hypothetical protein
MGYYSVIALAVSRLPSKTDEARREIYERARTALQEGLRGLDPPLSETVIANEQAALDAAICTLEVVTDMGGNAFVVLLWSFFESQRVQSLLGTTVTRRGTIVAELIRGYFNIDAAAIRVPVKTVLISLAGLQLFPLSKRLRHVIHETAKSLVVICSQLGKVKTRHGAFHKMQPITHSVAHNNLPISPCRAMI